MTEDALVASDGVRRRRVPIRVSPRDRRPGVGGAYDGRLIVRVREPAVDGRATAAALAALAAALGVPGGDVTLVHGQGHRDKLIEILINVAQDPGIDERLARLMGS